jgi:hypothetical protein
MKFRNTIIKKLFIAVALISIVIIIFISVADTLTPKGSPRQEFADIPPFPESEFTYSNIITDKTVKVAEKRYVVIYKSIKKAPEISAWFRAELPRYGWTLTVPPSDNDMPIQELYFEKTPAILNISIVENSDLKITEITIVLRPGPVREDLKN